MKAKSIQFRVLLTVISAMLAISIFVGGLSLYEVDEFVVRQTRDIINLTCEKETSAVNDIFGDMEKSVHIMESYVYDMINTKADVANPEKQAAIINQSDDMFADVAYHTDGAVAYYLRFSPEVSGDDFCGLFYSKAHGKGDFLPCEMTNLLLYDKDDVEHVGWYWQAYDAGEPVWMLPYYNLNNDIHMISYVVPLFCENEFVGIVGMDFAYTSLTKRIHDIKIYDNGFAHLEFDGSAIYNADHLEDAKLRENPQKYLSVSSELKNGMTLVISASLDDIKQIRYNTELKIFFVVALLTVLFSIIAILVVRRIVRPLKALTTASIKLSNGDYDVEIEKSNTYEIKLLSTAFENMAQNLKEHERLNHLLAYRDSLTGLRNTNSYKAWTGDFDEEIKSKNTDFGVMVLDINYLKETNDRYGHDMGNKLIVAAAGIISGTFKRSPVFRIGGDEFLVILQNRDLDDLDILLARFDEECSGKSIKTDNETIPVSIARGFARYDSGCDLAFVDVFNRADDAMYENKRKIKGLK